MLARIEHAVEPISGDQTVRQYADRHEKRPRLMYRTFLKSMEGIRPSGKCLEVGAGTGALSCLVAREHPGIAITAADISPHMVDLARRNVRENGLERAVRCVCVDVNSDKEMGRLGTFDLVYSTYSLHHWSDPRRALINLRAALTDGGMLYILDLRRVWWLYLLPGNGGFISSVRASYQPAEIGNMLKESGFTKCEVRTAFPGFIQSIVAWK
jgi:2-polyprenyl-3-methyl-5-hydroxy-6-metoxy-1,4-benzoquinol methylase